MVNPQQPTNRETVVAIRNGDARAFGAFVRLHYDGLIDFIARYVGAADSAKDVLQDVLIKVWERRDKLDPEQSLVSYLYTAARNGALNHHRGQRTINRYAESSAAAGMGIPTPGEDPSMVVEREDLDRAVSTAIDELPERCREIFLMNRRGGMSYSEIAKSLGISVSTVKTQMGRAVEFLAGKLLVAALLTGISASL